ncbi:hypothetical protein FB567DRAFT_440826, partial [Paraphoma chrysanthemicola]
MAQSKRRSPDDSNDSSPKKPRTEETQPDGSASQVVAPAQDGTPQPGERIQVSWILPSISKSDHNRDESQAVTKYAQSLFKGPWGAIRPMEQPFQFPLVRTPIYKAKGKYIAANDLHRPGVFFRTLFNKIKLQTGGSGASSIGSDTPYARDTFNRIFDAASDHDAVVASNSEANSILVLDQDYRLDVETTTTAHLNIIRRAAPEEDSPGYFIELPALGSVTINGRTFSNILAEGTTPGTALPPLIFGPLLRFTTLELLSQPVFFFRSRRDMDFTTPIASNNPGDYLASHFLRIMEQPEPRFIAGVLVGINARQPIELGFSIPTTIGDQRIILRLGRPLLLALPVKSSFVLLILQVTAEGAITAHILDPNSWTVSRPRRNYIVNLQFVPCAQTDQDLIAHVYTVLNAWALAMALSPNPRFALGNETVSRLFCHDATRLIVELTGDNGLQWKKVLAFFRHWDFILEADALPPIDRRFDTTKLNLGPAYVDYVIKEDRDFNASDQTLDFGRVAGAMGLTFSNGKGHNEVSSCETLTVDFKRDVIRPLAVAGLWDWNMTDEQLRAALAEHNATAQASQEDTSSGPDPPTHSSNALNDHEINSGLPGMTPCVYFRRTMASILSDPENIEQLGTLRSSVVATTGHHVWLLDSEVSLSVASVAQAISIVEGFEGGFSTTTQDQIQRKIDFPDLSQSDAQDAIRFGRPMLVPINIDSHLVLLLIQYDTTGKPQIAVFDS